MIKRISSKIIFKLNVNHFYRETEIEQMIYSLTALLNNFTKLILLLVIFLFLGNLKEFIFAFILSTVLRVISGGFHLKHYWTCFLFSLFYYISLLELYYLQVSNITMLLLVIIFSIILICLTPIACKQREAIRKTDKKICKLLALCLVLLYYYIYTLKKTPLIA
ncbi:accessory gene regulator B family protein [Clostridium grantii]|uniref:Accessory gene regulator B n=1 Tax=Clostridium grantii DSM 8605 TaxID=1121316 RepID=A0A1M5Y4Q2_9CLOT|nr:Accessory gene regulator B [Clostridium grantii DSM 8605]